MEDILPGERYKRELFGQLGGGMFAMTWHEDDPFCDYPDEEGTTWEQRRHRKRPAPASVSEELPLAA